MLKLLSFNPLFLFSTSTTPGVKYIIHKKAYLIEAPPPRPSSAYNLFVKDQLSGKKGIKVTDAMSDIAKKWKQYPELKEKFEKLTKPTEEYNKIKEEYNKKFVEPFKKLTVQNLRMKKLYTDKTVTWEKNDTITSIG